MADNYDWQYLLQLNKKCRAKGVKFIMGGCLGVYAYAFCDFGDQHEVVEEEEEDNPIFIESIDGDCVCLSESFSSFHLGVGDVV